MVRAVFLDRDGTLNEDLGGYFHEPDKLELLPGVAEGLKRMKSMGYLLIVVSNQSGVAKGLFTEDDTKAVNKKINKVLEKHDVRINKFYYCPHGENDGCGCRKPKTGMLIRASKEMGIDLNGSWLVGDKSDDAKAAENVKKLFPGFRFIGVETGHGMKDGRFKAGPAAMAKDLVEAAGIIGQRK